MEEGKTYEEVRRELLEKLQESGTQYVNEVAMPGIVRPVNPDDADK